MTDREKLVELLKQTDACLCDLCGEKGAKDRVAGVIATNILASGQVIVLPCKIGDEVWKVEPTGCNGAGCPYTGGFGNWRCNVNGKEECRPFVYWDVNVRYCEYLFNTGERRPCPAGPGCTVYSAKRNRTGEKIR